mmetsp:Transcript_10487/g.17147  ORF Transcript_10487/g.17147 Transcript_10487/m.17147 type:complete len:287 (-) Transcript_10487:595-1455(-)
MIILSAMQDELCDSVRRLCFLGWRMLLSSGVTILALLSFGVPYFWILCSQVQRWSLFTQVLVASLPLEVVGIYRIIKLVEPSTTRPKLRSILRISILRIMFLLAINTSGAFDAFLEERTRLFFQPSLSNNTLLFSLTVFAAAVRCFAYLPLMVLATYFMYCPILFLVSDSASGQTLSVRAAIGLSFATVHKHMCTHFGAHALLHAVALSGASWPIVIIAGVLFVWGSTPVQLGPGFVFLSMIGCTATAGLAGCMWLSLYMDMFMPPERTHALIYSYGLENVLPRTA